MGFKDYKIRDGVHIPSDKFRENWNDIFGKKKKKRRKTHILNCLKMLLNQIHQYMKTNKQ